MYKSTRNFCHPQDKPRMYTIVRDNKPMWVCKLMRASGYVVGYGQGRSMVAAFNAFVRDRNFRDKYPGHWLNRRR